MQNFIAFKAIQKKMTRKIKNKEGHKNISTFILKKVVSWTFYFRKKIFCSEIRSN